MDELVLALVSAKTSLPHALESIRPGTRALVVHSPDRPPLLVTAGDIMAAMNEAVEHDYDPFDIPISTVTPAHTPMRAPKQSRGRDSAHSFGAATAIAVMATPVVKTDYLKIFGQHDDRYAIHEFNGDTARVVTASERFAAELNTAITICRCTGKPVHAFEPRQLVNPGVCNKPHAVPVVCSLLTSAV